MMLMDIQENGCNLYDPEIIATCAKDEVNNAFYLCWEPVTRGY